MNAAAFLFICTSTAFGVCAHSPTSILCIFESLQPPPHITQLTNYTTSVKKIQYLSEKKPKRAQKDPSGVKAAR